MSIIRQRTKNLIAAGILGAMLMAVVTVIIVVTDQIQIKKLKQIASTNPSVVLVEEEIPNEMMVYLLSKDMKAGDRLSEEDVMLVGLSEDVTPNHIVDSIEGIVGKTLRINLSACTPVTIEMLYESEQISDDLRIQEFSMLYLPSRLEKNDAIDIRIKFPTGQDYIVLTKKRVQDIERLEGEIERETIWLQLDEEEILRISSALVDAYLHEGTKLYVLQYVDANIQEAAQVTYPVNQAVLELMIQNPNLVFESKEELEIRKRAALEEKLYELNEEDGKLAKTIPPVLEEADKIENKNSDNSTFDF